jgi:hypothetical protein
MCICHRRLWNKVISRDRGQIASFLTLYMWSHSVLFFEPFSDVFEVKRFYIPWNVTISFLQSDIRFYWNLANVIRNRSTNCGLWFGQSNVDDVDTNIVMIKQWIILFASWYFEISSMSITFMSNCHDHNSDVLFLHWNRNEQHHRICFSDLEILPAMWYIDMLILRSSTQFVLQMISGSSL